VSGAPDPRWSDDRLASLRQVPGSAFEVVQMGTVITQSPANLAGRGQEGTAPEWVMPERK
jgi:hypothetical protein